MSRTPYDDANIEKGMIDEVRAVDSLLSRALFQLSMNERNAMEEEIHGVRCLAPEETPQLLQSSLQTLSMVLASNEIIPVDQKLAYLQSQQLPSTYINSDDFRLRFLRLTLFDVVKAAKKMVRFIDVVVFLFGDVVFERPVRLQDLSKKEVQFLRSGMHQLMPFRDRSGRRIIFSINPSFFNAEENAKFPQLSPQDQKHNPIYMGARIGLYLTWVAGEDVETQRKGFVHILWFEPSFPVISTNRISSAEFSFGRVMEYLTIRCVCGHLCVPDTIVYRFIKAVIHLNAGPDLFLHMKAHYGESMVLRYKLQTYGIPTEDLPISYSGSIKTGYVKQWIRGRETQESSLYLQQPIKSRCIVECPLHTDVLFRQGMSMMRNPGNARVWSLIETKQSGRTDTDGTTLIKPKRRELVRDIIAYVSKTGRFLVWNDGGWWSEIVDQEQVKIKVEYLLKEARRVKRAAQQQSLQSSTSMFCGTKRDTPYDGNEKNNDDDGCGKGCL